MRIGKTAVNMHREKIHGHEGHVERKASAPISIHIG